MQRKKQVLLSTALLAGYFFIFSTALIGAAKAAENRFAVLEDGTVKDHKSGLIWAPQDNGSAIMWSAAVTYCKEYSFGGHRDWRMPTSGELATLYGNSPKVQGQDYQDKIDVATKSIKITSPWVWTNRRTAKNKAIAFGFNYGTSRRLYRGGGENRRALPVRSTP